MCGIVGIAGDPGMVARLTFDLSAALTSLGHRGPDDSGFHQDRKQGIYLGHTRLAVIDVSDQARQPMYSEAKDYIVAFNGVICNFKQLYQKYCTIDKRLNNRSDTAVLLNLLQQHGHSILHLLNGMFAIVAVDLKKNQILLARDRFGEKPLYWMQLQGAIAFASELRTLRVLGLLNGRNIDNRALGIYHALGSIPPPFTIYRGVQAVLPGSYLIFKNGRRVKEERYWTLQDSILEHHKEGLTRTVESKVTTLEILREAVRSRMVSDVPVGLFLSGGYDSSALLALCHDIEHPPSKALCIDFEEKQYSEYPQAQQIARFFGMEAERCVLTENDFKEGLFSFFRSMDQPTSDGYNTFFVSRTGRALGIKVWLSGVGGDELFGGYPSFRRLTHLRILSHIGQMLFSNALLDFIAPKLQNRFRWSRVVHMFDKGDATVRAFQYCRQLIPWRNVCVLLKRPLRDEISELPKLIDTCFPVISYKCDSFQAASILESGVYMRSQLLRDMDNFSMAHSIELRAPFLDHRLYHHLMGMKRSLKCDSNMIKPLLVQSLHDVLPQTFLSGPKRGFTFPVEIWMQGFLKQSFEEVVFDHSNSDFYDVENIRSMWEAHKRGQIHWSVPWNIYAFSRWRIEHSANAQ
jgi:asparagine synthase (glutamine-hydrolysing)